MTEIKPFSEWLKANAKYIEPGDLYPWLEEAWNAAVAAERERCAKLIEAYPEWIGMQAKREIAAAIRAQP